MAARWLPLESNPQVMNSFLKEVGVSDNWAFTDVYGLDHELLAMVPQPVRSLILLFPISEEEEEFRTQQAEGVNAAGQDLSSNLYFMKQYVGNACGTVAMIHAISNNTDHIALNEGPLKDFLDQTKAKDPEERGHDLENWDAIADVHDKLAKEGQSATPDIETKVEPHFITFVNVENYLYELDGRKDFPINHGSTNDETFLVDAASICRSFMERNPEESRFAMIALAPTE